MSINHIHSTTTTQNSTPSSRSTKNNEPTHNLFHQTTWPMMNLQFNVKNVSLVSANTIFTVKCTHRSLSLIHIQMCIRDRSGSVQWKSGQLHARNFERSVSSPTTVCVQFNKPTCLYFIFLVVLLLHLNKEYNKLIFSYHYRNKLGSGTCLLNYL